MPRRGYFAFRQLLIKTRKESGLTQAELAYRLGKPQSYVSKYEIGERRLDVLEFLEVAKAMNVDPLELVRELSKAMEGEADADSVQGL